MTSLSYREGWVGQVGELLVARRLSPVEALGSCPAGT
jgi:hypothetical protein